MELTLPTGAPATLLRPRGEPVGGVLVAHGGNDDGRHFFLDEAAALVERGLVVVLPAHRLADHTDVDADATAASVHRAVATHRHALDLLGPHATGFYGHSTGAGLGALLAEADPRPTRFALVGFGCGTLVRVARAQVAGHPGAEAYLAALERFDPRHHLAGQGHRVFVQHGRHDQVVPIAEGRALHAAAGPGARWAEYDCGHAPTDPLAARDRLEYLT